MLAVRPLAAVLALLGAFASTPAPAATPAEQCEMAKNNAAGKFALCRQKARAKGVAQGTMSADTSKCDEQLARAWQKAEGKAARAGATCADGIATGDMQDFLTDHAAAVAAALAGGGLPPVLPEACSQPYFTLDEPDRSVGFNDGDGNVELGDASELGAGTKSPDWNGPGWYRFAGAAGTQMPETAPADYSCGTDAPGWLAGAHPDAGAPVASLPVCFRWGGDGCFWTVQVNVASCGSFYLYELPETPETVLRYCGE